MMKLEDTIAWLKDFRDYFRERTRPGYNIEFHGCNVVDKFDEVLELLKAQQPRVIDISEIYTAKKLDVWIEDKSENIVHPLMLIETEMTNKSQTAFFYPMLVRPIKAYGKTWRCWTARPTDEQRQAVKWNEKV